MKKQPIPSFNIIRALSAVCIVLYHYSYSFYEYGIKESGPDLLKFKNGDLGSIFVPLFFILSGAALLYNYPVLKSAKDVLNFYKKRWLSIFPMFYIAWTVMYIINSKRVGGWFWGGPRKNFILSLIGMDGYFLHLGMNYYNLGEWFLGAIIFMYLLYPLLIFLWNRARIPSTILITAIFFFNPRRHLFSSAPDTNIFIVLIKYYNSHIVISDNMCIWTCLMYFWTGFIIITYFLPLIRKWEQDLKSGLIYAGVFFLLILPFFLFETPLNKLDCSIILSFLSFMMLCGLTPLILMSKPITALLNVISRYSYGVFLVHHVLLYGVMWLVKGFIFTRITSLIFFIPLFALMLLVSILLTKLSDLTVKTISRMLRSLRPQGISEDK